LIENGIDVNCKKEYGDNALTLLYANYSYYKNLDKNENLIDVMTLIIESGFHATKHNRDFFETYFKGKIRTEILQLLQQHSD
jgi:hypothetical protein